MKIIVVECATIDDSTDIFMDVYTDVEAAVRDAMEALRLNIPEYISDPMLENSEFVIEVLEDVGKTKVTLKEVERKKTNGGKRMYEYEWYTITEHEVKS